MLAKYLIAVLLGFPLVLTKNVTIVNLENYIMDTVQDALLDNSDFLFSLLQQVQKLESGIPNCDRDIKRLMNGLSKQEPWALRVVDSSSYFIHGLLNGNLMELGNYDECVQTTLPGEQDKYWTLYSLVEIRIEWRGNLEEARMTPEDAFARFFSQISVRNTTSTKDAVHRSFSKLFSNHKNIAKGSLLENDLLESEQWGVLTHLNLGICFPRSCGTAAPRNIVARLLTLGDDVLLNSGFRVRVIPPEPGADNVGLPPKFATSDWCIALLCVVLTIIVAFSTLFDVSMKRNPDVKIVGWGKHLLAFSLYTNGRKFLTVSNRSPNALTAIDGLKFFSILWIILGHRYSTALAITPLTNLIELTNAIKDWHKQLVVSANLGVDTFFTIGGILNAYLFFIVMEKQKRLNIFKFYIHRYIRVTPALALVTAISATWFYHIGSGPLWHKMIGEQRRKCEEFWWTNFLYVGNYLLSRNRCVGYAWYLMVDMQLHWFSPLVLLPLWHWRKMGLAWLTFLIALSCAIPFTIAYMNSVRIPMPVTAGDDSTTDLLLYVSTYSRASPYLVGLLSGYILYHARFVIADFRLGSKTVFAGWTLNIASALAIIFGGYPFYQFDNHIDVWKCALFIGFHRMGWSLSISWIALACATGYGGPVNTFLSWRPIVVLSRLVYGMYLTHMGVQFYDIATMRTPGFYSDFNLVQKIFSDSVSAILIGGLVALGVEYPLRALEKSLLERSPKKKEPTNNLANGVKMNPLTDVKTQL